MGLNLPIVVVNLRQCESKRANARVVEGKEGTGGEMRVGG